MLLSFVEPSFVSFVESSCVSFILADAAAFPTTILWRSLRIFSSYNYEANERAILLDFG